MPKRIIGNPTTTPMAMPDLNSKVDREEGKGLSTNDFTNAYKEILDNFNGVSGGGITDLGTFEFRLNNEKEVPEDNEEYKNTIDGLVTSGIYICHLWDDLGGFTTDEIFIVVQSDMDRVIQVKFTTYELTDSGDNPIVYPKYRCAAITDADNDDLEWSSWENGFDNKIDKSAIVTTINEAYEDGYSDSKIPSIPLLVDNFLLYAETANDLDSFDIEKDWEKFPNVDIVQHMINPAPIADVPSTLEANKAYNFGFVDNLSLSFPTNANDGDVIYTTFFAEADDGKSPNLIIDTTNTCDIELIPENSTGYEIFAKYNGNLSGFGVNNRWIVNYSEYKL